MIQISNHIANINVESETKIKIFNAAAKLFTEKGYYAVSMRELAEKANVTKPTIYYYFRCKEDLYKSLIRLGLEEGFEAFEQISKMDIPVKEKLLRLLKLRFRLSAAHPEFANFFLKAFSSVESLPFLEEFLPDIKRHREITIKIIHEAMASSEFGPKVNPDITFEIVGAVMFHYMRKQLKTSKKILTEELAEEIIELLYKGFNE
ncbi:TetR/AcrR family transcriptional regulator [candidate division KSB1 bacterium]|nr:TetR/AcrR family transcriptional regulator [candidate division KSB1 bacterium]